MKHAVSSACFPVTRLSLNRLPFAAGPLSARAHQPSSVQPGHARPRQGHAGPVAHVHRHLESTCDFPVRGGTGVARTGPSEAALWPLWFRPRGQWASGVGASFAQAGGAPF